MAALLVYSQRAFTWDEGFHLLAAQLIAKGKRPYADFLFAQPPVNAYINAVLIALFGPTWRPAHVLAALEVFGAVWLAAAYDRAKFITVAALAGFNVLVFRYSPVGQAYALCLLLTVAAYRLTVSSVRSASSWRAAAAGLLSGAAVAASLLTAPVAPILLVWLALRTRSARMVWAFAAGGLAGAAPLLTAMILWPRQAFFDIVRFHMQYRQVEWDNWLAHDLGVVTAWLDCVQAFILLGLAAAGLVAFRRNEPEPARRAELFLCGALAVAECIYVATAHPTFPQYFLLAVPFAAIVASRALSHMRWELLAVCITIAGLGRALYNDRDGTTWEDFNQTLKNVEAVTPRGAPLAADEQIYFLANRTPPPGLEWASGHKAEMPPDRARSLHLVPESELDREVREGKFTTVETCYETDIDRMKLRTVYKHEKVADDCYVFW